MNPEWMTYLQQLGASFEGNTIINFSESKSPSPLILPETVIIDLSTWGVIKVSGTDAENFLQGQLTNDVRQVKMTQSQLSAWCSSKGRMLVNFRVFKRQDSAIYLWLPRVMVESTLQRLRRYVLRSKVVFTEVSDQLLQVGVAGKDSTAQLTSCVGETLMVPTAVNASITSNSLTVLQVSGSAAPRYVIVTEEVAMMQRLWECISQIAQPVKTAIWDWLDILAGIPQILPATVDEFVPQMVNYQALEGISFTKGCYSGQEVVARMQYLAELKRRMYLVRIETMTLPAPGSEVYIEGEASSVGKLVNVQVHPNGGMVALAVLSISHRESQQSFRLATGEPLTVERDLM